MPRPWDTPWRAVAATAYPSGEMSQRYFRLGRPENVGAGCRAGDVDAALGVDDVGSEADRHRACLVADHEVPVCLVAAGRGLDAAGCPGNLHHAALGLSELRRRAEPGERYGVAAFD